MGIGGIQFGGLASGLDTGAIIDAILDAESRSIRRVEARKGAEQEKLTLLGTFESLVKTLREKARDLQLSGNFFAHTLTAAQEGFASFTLSGSAEAGAHTLEVNSLAAADRYAFAGVVDPEASLGSGTVSFTYNGTDYSVATAPGSDNLNDIAAAINTAAGGDVTATVVNVGTETTPSHQLVIAGDETGADFTITNLTSSVAGLTGATRVSTASNAQVVVDGLTVQRSTNLFSDVVPGISFSVSRTTEVGAPLSFTVDLDPAGIRENIQEFVDAYNAVIDFVGQQSSFSIDAGPGGPLFGDSALTTVGSLLRRTLFSTDPATVAADTEGYSTLGLIGIDVGSDGKLTIDQDQLDEKLNGNLDAFSDFFRAADDELTTDVDESGLFVRLEAAIGGLVDRSSAPDGTVLDGLFGSRKKSIGDQIRGFDDEIERLEFRLEKLEETLVAKFASLERLMAGMQTQQAYLASIPSFER